MRRLLGTVLVVGGLISGVVGAATAYLPPLTLPDAQLVGLTLNAPAGQREVDGRVQPIFRPGTTLTADRLAELRAAGVRRVRVREFALSRWTGRWLFAGAMGALVGAIILGRVGVRPASENAADARLSRAVTAVMPELEALARLIEDLLRQRAALPDDARARLRLVLDRLDEACRGPVSEIVEQRQAMVRDLGLGVYARFMDRFAFAERQMYRAWSCAVDAAEEEVWASLERAHKGLMEARMVLTSIRPGHP